jgi:hypothetical protein
MNHQRVTFHRVLSSLFGSAPLVFSISLRAFESHFYEVEGPGESKLSPRKFWKKRAASKTKSYSHLIL